MAASPGGLGGLRGLVHLRSILSSIGVIVLPEQIAVPRAFEVFDENGQLKDDKQQGRIQGIGQSLATMLHKLAD
jgi:chromate reductase